MATKKKKETGWLVYAILFMAICGGVYAWVSSGAEYTLKYDMLHPRDGYPDVPAWVTVWGGRGLKWAEVPGSAKIVGWVLFALIPLGAWYVGTERNKKKWQKGVFGFGPFALCLIMWIAPYSKSLDLGAYNGEYDKFISDFQVSPEQAAAIVKDGGSGTFEFKDESGLLKQYFKSKKK